MKHAVHHNETEIAYALIAGGTSLDLVDYRFGTALMHAIFLGNTKIALTLIAAGASLTLEVRTVWNSSR